MPKPLLLLSLDIMAMDILPIIMEDIMDIIMARDLPSQVMATMVMAMDMDTMAIMDIITASGQLSLDMAIMVMAMVTAMDTMDIMDITMARGLLSLDMATMVMAMDTMDIMDITMAKDLLMLKL